jgi:hypothetical protein
VTGEVVAQPSGNTNAKAPTNPTNGGSGRTIVEWDEEF